MRDMGRIEFPILSEKHLEKLRTESAISDEVIRSRGYRTVTGAKELTEYGFASRQRRVPALLIPIHAPDGTHGLYQIRPDNPRTQSKPDGGVRTLKYEMPVGATMRIDCPPACRPMIGDPKTDIWITEGVLKGDSMASKGLCVISLLGVWLFKSKNQLGGVTISTDFDSIAWNDRQVRIVFDSDVINKPSVRNALQRLTEILSRKKAIVTAVYLPDNPDGSKVGVDDYLRNNSVEELEALVTAPRILPQPAAARIELLDAPPEVMHRPLQILGGRGYVATWLHIKKTETEGLDEKGQIVRYHSPRETIERKMFIIRDDGVTFGDGGDHPLADLEFKWSLDEPLQDRVCMSAQAVKNFRRKPVVEISTLFRNIADVFDKFLDFDGSLADQRTMCEMAACFAIATWFIEAFNAAGYIYPTGEAGSGKTQFLSLMCQVAFLGELIQASGSFAAIRDLSNYGAFLGFDDAENVTSKNFDPDKRNILLSGTKRGSQIPLKVPSPTGRGWITVYVNTFAFRGFSAIRSPDPTLGSRTITVPLIRTSSKTKGDLDPLDFDLWPVSPENIRSSAWQIALRHLAEMRTFERMAKTKASITGRDLEAWTGVLSIALFIDSKTKGLNLFERMNELSLNYQKSRADLEGADLTRLVLRSVVLCINPAAIEPFELNELIAATSTREWSVTTAKITARAHELITAEELDFDIEGTSARRIGRVLSKLRLRSGSDGKKRGWIITADKLEKYLKAYSLQMHQQQKTDVSDVNYVTDIQNSNGGHVENPPLDLPDPTDTLVLGHKDINVSNVNKVKNVKPEMDSREPVTKAGRCVPSADIVGTAMGKSYVLCPCGKHSYVGEECPYCNLVTYFATRSGRAT